MTAKRLDPWKNSQPIVNGWLAIPSAYAAETMAQAGWDSLTVDLQHGVQDYASLVECLRGIELHGVFPMVRAAWNDPATIGKALDAGAWGVICPMVNTADDAVRFVRSCRYPPHGDRSFGPIRAAIYGEVGSYRKESANVRCIAMIETREAVENLESILDVPGLDGVYVGPGDLGLSYGYEPRLDRDEQELLAIFERIAKEAQRRGIRPGIHTASPAYAAKAVAMGFSLVTVGSDSGYIITGARQAVADVRALTTQEAGSEPRNAGANAGVVAELTRVLPPGSLISGDQRMERRLGDWSGLHPAVPLSIALPKTTEEVSLILRICHEHRQPVTVQGGLTGLAGGAVPRKGEIAISLERMKGVEEVDAGSATLTVLAGTSLQVVQEKAEEAGFQYGVDLGARGSCTIGGTAATNAGGIHVLRYGMSRQSILGLEAVLADGTVVTSLNKMLKNNTGYDWKQLLIGSEGTLGIITKLVLSLQPPQRGVCSALVATKDFDGALDLLRAVGKDLSGTLHSFEAMWPAFQKFATEACKLSSPLEIDGTLWLLLEVECDPQAFTDFLEKVFEEGLLLQASVAESEQQRQRFWALREIPVDFPRKLPGLIGFDVGIPRAQMSAALKDMEDVLQSRWPEITSLSYGHVADGNLHLVVHVPNVERQPEEEIHDLVYEIVQKYGGAISAEHGVGQNKKPWLHMSRTPQEIALMQSVKKALDPRGILNPGRIFG